MSDITTFEFTPFSIDEKKTGAESIENLLFNIPIYQRLYAWEEAEIKQLLEDLHRQFEKDRNSSYYLGNLVLYENENKRYDVIDGQQRLTTLFLIGLVFKNEYADWSKFLQKEKEIRLAFVAREDDNDFLKAKLMGKTENIASENLNVMMTNALRVIGEFEHSKNTDFQQYVFNKTTMVGIIIPKGIDLNKYFEDMNNRGVQLEKHEILKAKLLGKITDEKERTFYARLWDACSQMNQYVEYGFDKTLQEVRGILFENKDLKQLASDDKSETKSLQSILGLNFEDKHQKNVEVEKKNKEDADKKPNTVGSILNFPTFILHCYKIWKNDNNVKLSDKDLLDVFNEDTLKDFKAIEFIDFLFTCRVNYDAYFIKSIEDKDGNNIWKIREIKETENANEKYARKSHLDNTTVIQAMLNASTSLDNWFTPALKYVLCNKISKTDTDFCSFLENLDIELAKERMRGNSNLKQVTDNFLTDFKFKTDFEQSCTYETWFIQNLHEGTGTPRYWFFRLDYYLRKEWLKEESKRQVKLPQIQGIEQVISKIKNYQFRQNRSVEHIYPQNPENGTKWKDDELHNFGNLALISVRSNSSYNNQDFKDKKADFQKRTNNWGIESLKQLAVFENENWTAENAETHGEEMIKILIASMSGKY